jgi:hypothetical protein
MPIAGAAYGASKALEEILAEQMLRAKMEQQQQQEARRMALDEQRFAAGQEQLKAVNERQMRIDAEADEERRSARAQAQTDRNIGLDAANVLNMPGMTPEAQSSELLQSALRNPRASSTPTMLKIVEGLSKKPEKKYTSPQRLSDGTMAQFEEGQIPAGTKFWQEPKSDKPRVDIRNVSERGPGGEPGTRVITFNDGNIVSSQWFPGNPTGGERSRMADAETMRTSLESLKDLYKPEYVGPVAGRVGTIGQQIPGVPVDEDRAQFYAATSVVRNAVIKAITGAQMSEPEARRIKAQIPSENDKPGVWESKYLQSIANVSRLEEALARRQGTPTQGAEPQTPKPGGKTPYELYQERQALKAATPKGGG